MSENNTLQKYIKSLTIDSKKPRELQNDRNKSGLKSIYINSILKTNNSWQETEYQEFMEFAQLFERYQPAVESLIDLQIHNPTGLQFTLEELNKYVQKSSPPNRRLQIEKDIMAQELPQFQLYRIYDETFFEGHYTTTVGGNLYQLKLVLPHYYPNEMPRIFVTFPKRLRKHDYSGLINDEEISHSFHTLSNGPDKSVQICHSNEETWDASKTAVGAFTKGILWLEAYDVHLLTGGDIADTLSEFERNQ